MKKEFSRYVLKNMIGVLGVSVYVLADTFFIALYAGGDGIAVLNLALPLYGLIFAIGQLTGVGAATRFSLDRAAGRTEAEGYFSNALIWQAAASLPFLVLGLTAPHLWLRIMGGDAALVDLGLAYTRIVLLAAPVFMMNYTIMAFCRNDHAPTLAMAASLSSSVFNIVFDYIFMFPMDMGIAGAALATALSPLLSILLCSLHFRSKRAGIRFCLMRPSWSMLVRGCRLGTPGFVGELSSAVTTTVFNLLILNLTGKVGVAAYGVVANWAIVATAVNNGVAQGMQPLVSRSMGAGERERAGRFLGMGLMLALVLSLAMIAVTWLRTDLMVAIFNSRGDALLGDYARSGMRLYVTGYLFAAINIVMTTSFAAMGRGLDAFLASSMRGLFAIVFSALLLSSLWGMTGIWFAFLLSEGITLVVVLICWFRRPLAAYC